MRVSPNIACLQGRMIWGWLWLGPGWNNFRSPHSNYELNLFPASSTQDDTRMPSTFWGHCSQDDGRMIFEKFCFQKKESKKKIAVILFSRMMTTQTRMNHPKIAYHPGFMDKPEIRVLDQMQQILDQVRAWVLNSSAAILSCSSYVTLTHDHLSLGKQHDDTKLPF